MDMTRYTAITGVAILLLTQDKKTAPAPADWQNRSFEWAYVPMFLVLGLRCPTDALARLKHFDRPRRLERTVLRGGKDYPVQAVLEKTWMLGATTGLTRAWEQHCPATLHWKKPNGEIGWLLVHGTNGATATIEGKTLQVFLHKRNGETLRLLLHAPGAALEDTRWNLNGLVAQIHTSLGNKTLQLINDTHFGSVLEVAWPLPKSLPSGAIFTLQVQ